MQRFDNSRDRWLCLHALCSGRSDVLSVGHNQWSMKDSRWRKSLCHCRLQQADLIVASSNVFSEQSGRDKNIKRRPYLYSVAWKANWIGFAKGLRERLGDASHRFLVFERDRHVIIAFADGLGVPICRHSGAIVAKQPSGEFQCNSAGFDRLPAHFRAARRLARRRQREVSGRHASADMGPQPQATG